MTRVLKQLGYFVGYGLLGTVVTLVVVYIVHLRSLPDPRPWHLAKLASEFTAADAATVKTLDDYLKREEQVFAELRTEVYDQVAPEDRRMLNRFSAGSIADPAAREPNWNRTTVMPAENPRGGALLIHGLSDSPYSLRAMAEKLHAQGYYVVLLRMPGHGTAPVGLVRATWQDFAAAVRVGARDLRARIGPDKPMYLFGYSNGGALAVEYALSRLQGEDLPKVDGLVLFSPAIGVSGAAALAVWQGRASMIPGLEKLAWTNVGPEYDPYKYVSFAVNAGDQAYRLTQRIASQLSALGASGAVKGMPPILAFQSLADATVSTQAVVDTLFRRLAPGGHELVMFDINRHAEAAPLLRPDALVTREGLFKGPPLPFDLTGVVNESHETDAIVAIRRPAGATESTRAPIGLEWPLDVFSLSHVAIPFSPADPVYGAARPAKPVRIYLGRPELLGERGLLTVPANELIRLRHNPFFPYVEARIDAFLAANGAVAK